MPHQCLLNWTELKVLVCQWWFQVQAPGTVCIDYVSIVQHLCFHQGSRGVSFWLSSPPPCEAPAAHFTPGPLNFTFLVLSGLRWLCPYIPRFWVCVCLTWILAVIEETLSCSSLSLNPQMCDTFSSCLAQWIRSSRGATCMCVCVCV